MHCVCRRSALSRRAKACLRINRHRFGRRSRTAEKAINDSNVTKDRYETLSQELAQALQTFQQAVAAASAASEADGAEAPEGADSDVDDEEVIDADFKPAG